MTRKSKLYQYVTTYGLKGILFAESLTHAKILLYKQGIHTRRVRQKIHWFKQDRITPKQITLLTQQLGRLLNAGLSLTDALYTLQKTQTTPMMYHLLGSLESTVQEGVSLSLAFKQYPHFFNAFFCHTVALGEKTGELGSILTLLVEHRTSVESIQKKMKKALRYPLMVFTIAFFISMIILMFVVPQFKLFFENFNAELPAMTKIILSISHQLKDKGIYFITMLFFCLFLFRKGYKKFYMIKAWFDYFIFKLPYFGKILQNNMMGYFSKTLAIALNAGLPLNDALHIISSFSNNAFYQSHMNLLYEQILQGISLSKAMTRSALFPEEIIQMLKVAEETGRLEPVLNQIAEQEHERLSDTVLQLEQRLEPILMIGLGLFIGGLIIALYLPIFQLGSTIS